MDPVAGKARERLRWRCRRGLLELDLLLDRFVERHLDELDAEQMARFDRVLLMTDNELLDILMGRKPCTDSEVAPLLAWIADPDSGAAGTGRRHAGG